MSEEWRDPEFEELRLAAIAEQRKVAGGAMDHPHKWKDCPDERTCRQGHLLQQAELEERLKRYETLCHRHEDCPITPLVAELNRVKWLVSAEERVNINAVLDACRWLGPERITMESQVEGLGEWGKLK